MVSLIFNHTVGSTPPPLVGGDGGTVTILLTRTALQCNPDAVYFDVDLSASLFDTPPAEIPGVTYDPQFHDLDYYWTFGDPGEFTAPVNILPEGKNQNWARGKKPAHCYMTPGMKTVTLMVVEPSSGKVAMAEETFEVIDRFTAYPGDRTVCIYPVGGSPGTVPAGAITLAKDTFRTDDPDWISLRGLPRQFLFQRGGTYTVGIEISASGATNMAFGDYGTGEKPILNTVTDQSVRSGNKNFHFWQVTAPETDMRVYNFKAVGTFDPALYSRLDAPSTVSSEFCTSQSLINHVIANNEVEGFSASVGTINITSAAKYTWMYFNNYATKFGGQYPVFFQGNSSPASRWAMVGCGLVQSLDAYQDPVSARGNGTPIRVQSVQSAYMRGVDIYNKDFIQLSVKMHETPFRDGMDFHAHNCTFEGGSNGVTLNGNIATVPNNSDRSYLINSVIEDCIFIGTCNNFRFITLRCGGTTIRNNLFLMPSVPTNYNQFTEFLYVKESENISGTQDQLEPTPAAYGGPIKYYNNTQVTLRTDAQNTNFGNLRVTVPITQETGVGITPFTIVESNNIFHRPSNGTPVTTFAPLDTTPLSVQGRHAFETRTLGVNDPSFGTPANSVASYKPQTGSSALGAATGLVAYRDITGAARPASKDIGAWQVTT